jgi:hypothetical protein
MELETTLEKLSLNKSKVLDIQILILGYRNELGETVHREQFGSYLIPTLQLVQQLYDLSGTIVSSLHSLGLFLAFLVSVISPPNLTAQ